MRLSIRRIDEVFCGTRRPNETNAEIIDSNYSRDDLESVLGTLSDVETESVQGTALTTATQGSYSKYKIKVK